MKDLALGLGWKYGERHCEMLRFAQHDKFLYQTDSKKSFEFCYAFLTEVSVIACNSLVHSVVPTDTPVAGYRWKMPYLSPKRQKIITGMINFFHTYEKIIWAVPNSSF